MPDCAAPLWPCAMTGAAACLAGIRGVRVIIHGPSGCYFYPASLLHAPLSGTLLLPEEVICGSLDRLAEVVAPVAAAGEVPAVLTTCPTSLTGEDVTAALSGTGAILVDCGGFDGLLEEGYQTALRSIGHSVRPDRQGVNIGGLSLVDPFSRGNCREAARLLQMAGISPGSLICTGTLGEARRCSPLTIGTNPDLPPGVGDFQGDILGLPGVCETFTRICEKIPGSDPDPVIDEADRAGNEMVRVADKYLRRYDPPVVVTCGQAGYAGLAATLVEEFLDGEVAAVLFRNTSCDLPFPTRTVRDLPAIGEIIHECGADLVIGSSFERSITPGTAWVGITPPIRGRVRLASPPIAGIEGSLFLFEEILNACISQKKQKTQPA